MNNFLDELMDLAEAGFHEDVVELLSELGENARRMLDIGIVQDEIIKIKGDYWELNTEEFLEMWLSKKDKMPNPTYDIKIVFEFYKVTIELNRSIYNKFNGYISDSRINEEFLYNSPTWQQDLINHVKELIK